MKKKKKPLTLIRVIRNNKNPPKENRERERERTHNLFVEKIWIKLEIISNLYKIKWIEEESKYKIYERMKEV